MMVFRFLLKVFFVKIIVRTFRCFKILTNVDDVTTMRQNFDDVTTITCFFDPPMPK